VLGDHLVHRQVVIQQRETAQPQFAFGRLDRYRATKSPITFGSFGHALAPLVLGNRVAHGTLGQSVVRLRAEFPAARRGTRGYGGSAFAA